MIISIKHRKFRDRSASFAIYQQRTTNTIPACFWQPVTPSLHSQTGTDRISHPKSPVPSPSVTQPAPVAPSARGEHPLEVEFLVVSERGDGLLPVHRHGARRRGRGGGGGGDCGDGRHRRRAHHFGNRLQREARGVSLSVPPQQSWSGAAAGICVSRDSRVRRNRTTNAVRSADLKEYTH